MFAAIDLFFKVKRIVHVAAAVIAIVGRVFDMIAEAIPANG